MLSSGVFYLKAPFTCATAAAATAAALAVYRHIHTHTHMKQGERHDPIYMQFGNHGV